MNIFWHNSFPHIGRVLLNNFWIKYQNTGPVRELLSKLCDFAVGSHLKHCPSSMEENQTGKN